MNRSKSTLALIEQIIVIAIFAVCAAVCVSIITTSYLMTVEAVDTRNALTVAESAAESFKAFEGDVGSVFELLGGQVSGSFGDNNMTIFYDADWKPSTKEDADFVLNLLVRDDSPLVIFADAKVSRTDDDTELVSLTAAVRRFGR